MEIGEFEFDISNVAAFESVATEDPIQEAQQKQQQQQIQLDQQLLQQDHQHLHLQQQQQQHKTNLDQLDFQQPLVTSQQSPLITRSSTSTPQPSSSDQQQNVHQTTSLQLQQSGQLPHQQPQQTRILLVPINPGKQLYQLATLTTSGNRKQIIKLAPIQSSQVASASASASSTSSPNQSFNKQLQQLRQHHQSHHFLSLSHHQTQYSAHPNSSQSHNHHHLHQQQQQHQHQQLSLNKSSSIIPTEPTTNEVPKRKPCNCTKSQCLKLYCDCFANGEFCSGCNCTNCFNSLEKEKERQKAISQCLERNPEAFRPKIGKAVKASIGEPAPDSIERRHTKGCNCKRSGCLKNYCECYEAKILCSNLCKCCGCKNYEESFERKSLMQLANSQSENARGILKNLLPTNVNSNTGRDFTRCFITDKVINASLVCLLQSAQQAEKDGLPENSIPDVIQNEMGKCLRMIVDSAMTYGSKNNSTVTNTNNKS